MKRKIFRKGAVLFVISLTLALSVYYRLTANELNLFTGMLFLAALFVSVCLFAEIAMMMLARSHETKAKIRLSLVTTSILVVILEMFLRTGLGRYSNYHENNGSRNYRSLYRYENSSWFHVHEAGSRVIWNKKEFSHIRDTNSLGLSEIEITKLKAPTEYRIIALGDSFTEGVGTSYDSTWVKAVENNLSIRFPTTKITTINAGISGSDPVFEYVLLREKLISYHPDLVIVAMNQSDITDIIIKGGMDRFQSDGKLGVQRKGPNWEWIYGINYIFRHIVHDLFQYNWLLMTPDQMWAEERSAARKLRLSINSLSEFAAEHKFNIVFVFHPHEFEIQSGRYSPTTFHDLIAQVKRLDNFHIVDLLEYYQRKKIITKENSREFYWSTDLHHNTRGYKAMGEAIAAKIMEFGLLSRSTKS